TGYDATALAEAPQVGQVLVRGQGSWTGSTPLNVSAVKWQRCDAAASTCTQIATTAKYTVQTSDAGFALRLVVTMQNPVGSTMAVSAVSSLVGSMVNIVSPPTSTTAPVVSGT